MRSRAGPHILRLQDQALALHVPGSLAAEIEILFGPSAEGAAPAKTITVHEAGRGRFALVGVSGERVAGLTRGATLNRLMEEAPLALTADLTTGVALHAGAVGWNGGAILISGASGVGKSSLTAWFVDRGLRYLTEEVAILDEKGAIAGLPRALVIKPGSAEAVASLPSFGAARRLRAEASLMLRPAEDRVERGALPCRLIVFPDFAAGAKLAITAVNPAQAALRLMGQNANARNLADGGFAAITALTREAPAVALRYGDFSQLAGVVDVLAKFALDGAPAAEQAQRILSAFAGASTPAAKAVKRIAAPSPTPRRTRAELTIGMATYDDYDGVYFTIQSLRLHHPEILDRAEFVVIDNNPSGPCAAPLKALEEAIPTYRYVPVQYRSGTTVKDVIFHEATGDYVLGVDSHVLIASGAVQRLLDYFAEHPGTRDLLHGPLLHDSLAHMAVQYHAAWRGGTFGFWRGYQPVTDTETAPFEIGMQGMGLFACRRAAWPGFNPAFRGWGLEEGYIHEKFRRAGGRVLCLPFLRWLHRFQRPLGTPYLSRLEDRMRNYLIGYRELGLPTREMEAHYRELIGDEAANAILQDLKDELAGS